MREQKILVAYFSHKGENYYNGSIVNLDKGNTEIAAEMIACKSDIPLEKVKNLFCNETGYQTPKVDTRAAVFKEGKILLVHEKNGTWSLPGGWCDVNQSVAENTVKETLEEAGLNVKPVRMIAVQDRNKHNDPPYAYGIVKVFILCEVISGAFTENIETTEIRYFGKEEIPETWLWKDE